MQRRSNLRGLFADNDSAQSDDFLAELDEATYGKLGAIGNSRIVAEGYSIYDLQPDPQQPRRVIPSSVRRMVDIHDMRATMERWYHSAERELGRAIPLRDLIEGRVEDGTFNNEDIAYEKYPIGASFLSVARLAGDIKRDGLQNPITIFRWGRTHMINTGERRWFAFHLLASLYGSTYERIPAREETRNIWAQASENLSREDLGGIALTRQFALLLMSLYPDQSWGSVTDFMTDEGSDRPFYAQVADGDEWRIPRNKGQQIADAMQASVSALRAYRQILDVPNSIWIEADDGKWSTHRLREWLADANKEKKPKPFQRNNPPTPEPPVNNDTVAAATVYDENKDDGYVPLSEEQRKAALPPGYEFAHVSDGTNDDTPPVPQDDVSAMRFREAAVRPWLRAIHEACVRVEDTQDVLVIPIGERMALVDEFFATVDHLLKLARNGMTDFDRHQIMSVQLNANGAWDTFWELANWIEDKKREMH